MNKKLVILEVARNPDNGSLYLFPNRYSRIDQPDLYKTFKVIEGEAAIVEVLSDEALTDEECKEMAVAFMTCRYQQWSFNLADENPKWERTK